MGRLAGYLDDGLTPGLHNGVNVVGRLDALAGVERNRKTCYITALGDNPLRRKAVERLDEVYGRDGLEPWSLIHPAAGLGENIEIGAGTCMAPGVVLTANVQIGRHCILNIKSSVSHDCMVGDYVNINPAATVCGWVKIGEGAYIGAGAVVKDRVSIGAWSVIGAGAVVIRDVPPNVTVVGVPAKTIG
jgi:acetyltransferase EpsM